MMIATVVVEEHVEPPRNPDYTTVYLGPSSKGGYHTYKCNWCGRSLGIRYKGYVYAQAPQTDDLETGITVKCPDCSWIYEFVWLDR